MLEVPAGQACLDCRTLPASSFSSMRICAADGVAQLFTSWPRRLSLPAMPLAADGVNSVIAKSLMVHSAWTAMGASSSAVVMSRVFMGRCIP